MKKIIFGLIFMMAVVLASYAPTAQAKKKSPAFNKKNISLKKGSRTKISIKNASPKKVKWTVNKAGKSVITLSAKNKKNVMVRGKKTGTATVTAKVTLKGKNKKTLRAKIKVSDGSTAEKKPGTSGTDGKEVSFPGKVVTSLTDDGYVRLQWDKSGEAEKYEVQRKTEAGTWKRLKYTFPASCTDKTVEENSTYYYRVRAKMLSGEYSAFSDVVVVRTGKITSSEDPVPTAAPTPIPEDPDSEPEPTETPEPTPYKAKYTYEVEVLNQFTIYENVPVVLYVKTDKPSRPSFSCSGISVYRYEYEDIRYFDRQEEQVEEGWICTIQFSEPGKKIVNIEEFDETDKSGGKYGTYKTVDMFQIDVQDGEKALQQHCNNIIKTVSNKSYNEDGLGKWSTLSGQQKMKRLEKYVISQMHYPRLGAETSLGYLPVWIIQENVGAFWETGFADCGAANEMMCVLARTLGYEAHRQNTALNGGLHIVAMVTIDGEEYKYDATPWQGGYKDWDYIF